MPGKHYANLGHYAEGNQLPWWENAACVGKAPDFDTTDAIKALPLIKEYCDLCPVKKACLSAAKTMSNARVNGGDRHWIPEGIWGGKLWRWGQIVELTNGTLTRKQCGTVAGYVAHKKAHEEVCPPCWRANAEYQRAWHQANKYRKAISG